MPATALDAREVLLQSGIRAFALKGFAGTSVQDVLEKTDLSKPTLYYYFESKAGLFKAILDYAYDEAFSLMKAGVEVERSCQARLVEVALAFFTFAHNHQNLTRLVFATIFAAPEEIPLDSLDPAKRRRNFEFALKIVKEGQQSGELDLAYDAVELTQGILGAITYRVRMHLLQPELALGRPQAERMVSLFMVGARRKD